MKNVLVFALNKLEDENSNFYEFTDENNEYRAGFKHINEAAMRYLIYKFERENKTLDHFFMFVSKSDFECCNHERFTQIFPAIPADFVVVSDNFIKENLAIAPEMSDKIIEYKNSVNDEINISFDLTCPFKFNSIILSLIQLVKYNNFNIDYILYANTSVSPNVIEEVSDFVNLPTLITGAEEFISNGSAEKIQRFFSKSDTNEHIKNLFDKMNELSDTLRVCGSYEVTKNALLNLNDAIKEYELFLDIRLKNLLDKTKTLSTELKKCESFENAEKILVELNNAIAEYKEAMNKKEKVKLNELYFSKLLPKIKLEYDDILPQTNKKSTPIEIIRWYLKMNLIGQAVTYYTEWLPRFLVENKYINVLDKTIIEECNSNLSLWTHWTNVLFRSYQVRSMIEINVSPISVNNLHQLMIPSLIVGDVSQCIRVLNGRDTKLDNLLKRIKNFSDKYTLEEAENVVVSLQEEDLIKTLLKVSAHGQAKFQDFVKARLKNEKSVEKVLVKALGHLPKNQVKNFYSNMPVPVTENSSEKKVVTRRDIFEFLLKNKKMSTPMVTEKLLDFVQSYDEIVRDYRNKFAHATADEDTVKNQGEVAKKIEESLDLIDIK